MIEEPEEELENPILEPYISSKESTMAWEGEGEVHNVNGEHRIGGGRGRGRGRGVSRGDPETFGFPIFDEDTTTTIKNISPSILPNFHWLRNDDPETFIFDFEVLCRSYDSFLDTQNLILLPTTLKDAESKWFMGLGAHSIRACEETKNVFLEK